jgi:uncharacterized protein involved in type VI secretion and phage assembly
LDRQHNGLELDDTKGVIRSRKSQDRQHNGLELEDTKGVIRSRKSQDRQHNGLELEDTNGVIRSRKSKDKQWFTKHYRENKNWVIRIPEPLKQEVNSDATEG